MMAMLRGLIRTRMAPRCLLRHPWRCRRVYWWRFASKLPPRIRTFAKPRIVVDIACFTGCNCHGDLHMTTLALHSSRSTRLPLRGSTRLPRSSEYSQVGGWAATMLGNTHTQTRDGVEIRAERWLIDGTSGIETDDDPGTEASPSPACSGSRRGS